MPNMRRLNLRKLFSRLGLQSNAQLELLLFNFEQTRLKGAKTIFLYGGIQHPNQSLEMFMLRGL